MIDNTRVHRTMRNTPVRRSKKRGTPMPWEQRLAMLKSVETVLRTALASVKLADAPMLAGRIRAAIKSAGGAVRHAELAPYREARQAKAQESAKWEGHRAKANAIFPPPFKGD